VEVLAAEERTVSDSFEFPLQRALSSPRVWALALVYFGIAYGLYGLAFFLPSIISGFKKTFGVELSIVHVGLITAIPYAVASVAMYVWWHHADRTREHVRHVVIPMFAGGLAIPVALYLGSPVLVMIPVVITAAAVFSAIPSFWALPSRFLTGAAAAGAIGLINSLGNLDGFAAPYATGALEQATGTNNAGMWAVGAVMLVSAVVVVLLRAADSRTESSFASGCTSTDDPYTARAWLSPCPGGNVGATTTIRGPPRLAESSPYCALIAEMSSPSSM
jgi:nitrate/nitrite transporter NarK